MRFSIAFSMRQDGIPIDYHRMMISFLKKAFEKSDSDYFYELYKEEQNKMKDFAFSVYFYKPEILKEEIRIPDRRFKMFFSDYDIKGGIKIFNAFINMKGVEYKYKGYTIVAERMEKLREYEIKSDEAVFKTLSPIVIKEHTGNNKTTRYHSLDSEEGRVFFVQNLKNQLEIKFGKEKYKDFEGIEFTLIKNKKLRIKHYDIVVDSNHAVFKLHAKPYILDYFYKAGIGANRSRGFGFVDIEKGED